MRSRWRQRMWLTLVALWLCSCATPYRPMKSGKGYAEAQIAPDQFRVSFQGNGQTGSEQTSDFAMLRAAQVTLQHGFGYFAVTDVTNTSSARPYIVRQRFHTDYPPNMGLPPPTPGGYDPYRFGYIVEYQQPTIYFQPGTSLLIQCFKTRPEKPFTYDASAVERSIKQKYKMNAKR